MPVAAPGMGHAAINWLAVATAIYAFIAGMLLLRLAVGISLTWRLVRAAKPMSEPWTADWSVRVSNVIAGPVTFGSTILLPPQFSDWDALKRRAVLAHEGAHVANRDFYVLLLASLNRAVFWFSPFAWWQSIRLAELGAGELLVTSMDRDGTRDGYDLDLTRTIADAVAVPVIASGGVGLVSHLVDGVIRGHASAVLAASIFHFGEVTIAEARASLAAAGLVVRA